MTELPIPLEALEDCGAILGRRGAGKSGAGRLLFEHELERGHRCCAIDPKGDWWGIRMAKGGGPSGFDIPIFGGTHGDLALGEDMGEMLGRLVATHDLSCVVDLSAFPSQAAQRRFARDFAEALFEHNRQPLTLFLDEADQLAPQRVPADMARLLHAMETLIRLGRQRGIFMWMLTQRPQILNKNLLSQADSLVAMKVTTPHDRGAIRDWMNAHDPDAAAQIEKLLAKLEVGEAFAWVPSADFLERVRFPLFRTYDSGRTPRHGETVEAVELPTIDLSALREALASAAADAAGYPDDTIPADPKAAAQKGGEVGRMLVERDRRIAELEAELAQSRGETARLASAIEAWNDRVNGEVLESWRATLDRFFDANNALFGAMSSAGLRPIGRPHSVLDQTIHDWSDNESQAKPGADAGEALTKAASPEEPGSRPAAGRSAAATAERMAATAGETAPSRPVLKRTGPEGPEPLNATAVAVAQLLKCIAPDGVDFNDALLLVGRRPGSGDAGKARKALLDHGLMVPAAGKALATRKLTHGEMIVVGSWPDASELVDLWEQKLRGPGGEILRDLYSHGPASKERVAQRLGKSPTSGWFGKGMKDLRRCGIVRDLGRELHLHPYFKKDDSA